MKNKKIYLSFISLVIIIILVGFLAIKKISQLKNNQSKDYVPEEEISDNQSRETIVTLYFLDKDSNTIKPEARLVDIKNVINSPYSSIIELLIEGPKNEKLTKLIPDNTQLLKTTLDSDTLILDFSDSLLNYDKQKDNSKNNLIYSIVNTVTELNEVNKVKFLINGKENEEFKDTYFRK